MVRIFISYSRKNQAFAEDLARQLTQDGAEVWIDVKNITPGVTWMNAIDDGLKKSDIMLVVVTQASMNSKQVEKEWQYFLRREKPIIPIWLEEVESQALNYQFINLQWVNFLKRPFPDAYTRLTEALQAEGFALKSASRRPAAPIQPPPPQPLPRQQPSYVPPPPPRSPARRPAQTHPASKVWMGILALVAVVVTMVAIGLLLLLRGDDPESNSDPIADAETTTAQTTTVTPLGPTTTDQASPTATIFPSLIPTSRPTDAPTIAPTINTASLICRALVIDGPLNFRWSPYIVGDANVIRTFSDGEEPEIIGWLANGSWYQVRDSVTGRTGWISADSSFTTPLGDCSSVPVVSQPSTPTATFRSPTIAPTLTVTPIPFDPTATLGPTATLAPNIAPEFISVPSQIVVQVNNTQTFSFSYFDANGDVVTFIPFSANVSIASVFASGASNITVAGVSVGSTTITIQLDDGRGGSASTTIPVTITQ